MINTDKSEMSLRLDTNLELKQLFKIFNFKLFKDDLQINSLDLDYNEKILFQLKMINVICKRENKQNLVLIAIPFITETILDYISTIDNAKVLVFPNKVAKNVKIDSKNVFYFSVDCAVDLYDDNTIYDLCLSANKNYSINEYKNKLMEEVMKIII